MANGLVGNAYKEIFEDWTGADNISTAVADGIRWLNTSDGGNTAFAIVAHNDGPVCQAATDATDNDMCELGYHLLTWSVQNGQLMMETRVRVSVGGVDDIAINVGFNDDVLEDSNTLPVELATATWTTNASSWAGIVYDADATNQDVHFMSVDDDNDLSTAIATLRFNGIAPVDNEWFGVNIQLNDAGSGNPAIATVTVVEESTGRSATKQFTTNLDRDVLLTPHIAFENRAGVAHTFEIDYIRVRQSRAST